MKNHALKSILPISLILFSNLCYALDAEVIALIHNKTRETLTKVCQEKMKKITPMTCACLGDKAQANIDDDELANCPDYGSKMCVRRVVETATIMALSKDSVAACISETGDQATPDTPSMTSPLSPNRE